MVVFDAKAEVWDVGDGDGEISHCIGRHTDTEREKIYRLSLFV